MRKLNIGAGPNPIAGWLNTDLNPSAPGVVRMNAVEPFPFSDGEFDRIFSEHMIEHVSYAGGRAMLTECFRVLKPGGRIRISTPSLDFLVDMFNCPDSTHYRPYVSWACETFSPGQPVCAETVVNNFVRAWGHQYIYSFETLRGLLRGDGFSGIKLIDAIGTSADPEFVGLENAGRMPEGFLQLETMTLEADRP